MENIPTFVEQLSSVAQEEVEQITNSSATIFAIVSILNTIGDVSTSIQKETMRVSTYRTLQMPSC